MVSGAYTQSITNPSGSTDSGISLHTVNRRMSFCRLYKGQRPGTSASQSQKPLESHVWATPQQVVPPHIGLPSAQGTGEGVAEEVDKPSEDEVEEDEISDDVMDDEILDVNEVSEDVLEEDSTDVEEDLVGRCNDE